MISIRDVVIDARVCSAYIDITYDKTGAEGYYIYIESEDGEFCREVQEFHGDLTIPVLQRAHIALDILDENTA